MKICLVTGVLFYVTFVNWHSLKEMKQGDKLGAIYYLLLSIATMLFIIATRALLR